MQKNFTRFTTRTALALLLAFFYAFSAAPSASAAGDMKLASYFSGYLNAYLTDNISYPDGNVRYLLRATNDSSETITQCKLTLTYPGEPGEHYYVPFGSATEWPVVEYQEADHSYNITSIGPGAGVQITLGYYPPYEGEYVFSQTGTYDFVAELDVDDANPADNSETRTLTIKDFYYTDLVTTTILVSPPVINWSETSQFITQYANEGSEPAYDVYVSCYPAHQTTSWQTSSSLLMQNSRFYIPVLYPGERGTITAWGVAKNPGEFRATSYIESYRYGMLETDADNNASSATQQVYYDVPIFDLVSNLDVSTQYIQRGGIVEFSMGVTNLGPDTATSISLLNMMGNWGPFSGSSQLELVALESTDGWNITTWPNGFVTGDLSTLAADQSATISVLGRLKSNATGTFSNSISVTSFWPQTEANPAIPDKNSASTAIMDPISFANADLSISSSIPDRLEIYQPATLNITAKNQGPSPTSTAYLSSLIPQGLQVQGVTSSRGTAKIVGKSISLAGLSLDVGQNVDLQVEVVPTQLGAVTTELGTVSNNYDPTIGNNLTKLVTNVVESVDCADFELTVKSSKIKNKLNKKTGSYKVNGKVQVNFTNIGQICSPATNIKVYQSADATLDPSDTLVSAAAVKSLCPNAIKPQVAKLKIKTTTNADPSALKYIVVVDEEGQVSECDRSNNQVVVD